jgi:hypothetical protein
MIHIPNRLAYAETDPHLVVPFPFNFERFNVEFCSELDAPDSQKYKVAEALAKLGRAGAEQIAAVCGLTPYTVRKRLAEIKCATRTTETRRAKSGRPEQIWEWK